MELEQARKRAAELRAVIEKNNRLYYDQDAPELEDYEYDQLTRGENRIWRELSAMPDNLKKCRRRHRGRALLQPPRRGLEEHGEGHSW